MAELSFVALDFEFGMNLPTRTSIIEVGLQKVEMGEFTANRQWLVNPESDIDAYASDNIHGIYPSDVAFAPTFAEIWPQIVKFIGDLPIVVHDVANERHAIITNAKFYDLQLKPLRFIDTFKLAPNMWPGATRYGLNALAERLHLSTDGEHSALVDAQLSAKVLLAIADELNLDNLVALLERLGFDDFGIIDVNGGKPLKQPVTQLSPRELEEWLVPNSQAPENLFKNQTVLVSGQFQKINKHDLQQAIAQRGGLVQKRPKAVANKTDVVIFSDEAKAKQSKKFVDAVYAKHHGRSDLYLMSESELNKFLGL
ncbi:hypothetical protein EQG49_10010 [Periweissella cryptocerci]|uniref:BRCT domain-containing protein n=1 Tax=Periweissella cryptocerci TaxID=2506420 RepID=A0A4P6YVF3_9LACO|nr:exonuclease domain-containing protein [Periweissella cryptocerci]QBO36770.1 hypothetical protein EQG49_10010 [Periweissella cryptocerci]